MVFKAGLLILVTSLQAVSANADKAVQSRLLPSQSYIEACQREALGLHPGVIDNQRVINRHGGFWVRYEIQMRGGTEWSVVCDLANGEIIREQRVVEKAF